MENNKGRILAILLVLLIVAGIVAGVLGWDELRYRTAVCLLRVGQIGGAAQIHQQLGDYKDLADKICDAAEARCQKLLERPRYTKYGKVAKLYETLQDHPAAIEKMDAQLLSHATQLLDGVGMGSASAVEAMCEAFCTLPAQYSLIYTQICIAADASWERLNQIVIAHYNGLLGKCLRPEAIGRPMYDFVCQEMQEEDYHTAGAYCYKLLDDDQTLIADMHAFLLDRMHTYLQEDDRNSAANLIYFLDDDGGVEQISRAVYDHGCSLAAQGEYERAAEYFYILRDVKDPHYYNDTYFMLLQLRMRSLLEEGKFSEAKALIGGYTGEQRQILLAIYNEYSEE